jgi:hypothetical protein
MTTEQSLNKIKTSQTYSFREPFGRTVNCCEPTHTSMAGMVEQRATGPGLLWDWPLLHGPAHHWLLQPQISRGQTTFTSTKTNPKNKKPLSIYALSGFNTNSSLMIRDATWRRFANFQFILPYDA